MAVTKDEFVQLLSTSDLADDTVEIARKKAWDHGALVGILKSLEAQGAITSVPVKYSEYALTAEAGEYKDAGAPEGKIIAYLTANGPTSKEDLGKSLGEAVVKNGFGPAMKENLLAMDKETKLISLVQPAASEWKDQVQSGLVALSQNPVGTGMDTKVIDKLKARKLIKLQNVTGYKLSKSSDFEQKIKEGKAETTLTTDMMNDFIKSGKWKDDEIKFKPINFAAKAPPLPRGELHPLMNVREYYRKILMSMGFQEMRTNQFVESSFWNFDSLYQPQQHPVRDAHDTFFCSSPSTANEHLLREKTEDYLERVKSMHEVGGNGSTGWKYTWSKDEAMTTILRTHTTANTSATLYKLAQEYKKTGVWKPVKYFSIDRVFRNETLDSTHLAEFHQAEGFVAAKDLTLGHLIGTFEEFFRQMGVTDLEFKPAYNPYTEPSMEIFAKKPGGGRMEIGNSGMFRREMVDPMGIPEDVNIIAWGISLERPAMKLFNMQWIRQTWQIDLANLRNTPIAWYKEPPRTRE